MIFIGIVFFATFLLFGALAFYGLQMSSEADKKGEGRKLSNNQWRALAWGTVIFMGIVMALIEYAILVKDNPEGHIRHTDEYLAPAEGGE
ncbi:MAG: hypothetical protein RLY93_07270 [Sumerlaeia bacterium]